MHEIEWETSVGASVAAERLLTRRAAIALLACAGAGVVGLAGCGGAAGAGAAGTGAGVAGAGAGAAGASVGFSPDTEVKGYPVELKVYADADLAWYAAGDGTDRIAYDIGKYRQQDGRGEVTVQVAFLPAAELGELARAGFPDGDALIADAATVEAACDAGVADAGAGSTSVRTLAYAFPASTCVVCARGSGLALPSATTATGADLPGESNLLEGLASVDGALAVADASAEPVGASANMLLHAAGLYSEAGGTGGSYAESIADRVRVFANQDEAMAAVADGTCAFGFAFEAGLAQRYPQVERCYIPPGASNVVYQGVALARSGEPGMARDFLQYMTMVSG